MKPRTILAVLAPLVVLAAGVGAAELLARMASPPERSAPAPLPTLVQVVRPTVETVQLSVTAHGEVAPRTALDLVAEVAGAVQWVSPALVDGGFFEAGEALVRIDPRDYQLALARAELELARAERLLAEEEAAGEVATREWERLGRGEGTALALRRPQLAEARAQVAAAEAELELRRRDLERTELTAPFVGRVASAAVEAGAFVTRGQALARLWAVDFAEVRLPLPDEQLAFLDLPLGPGGLAEGEDGDRVPATGPEVALHATFAGAQHTWTGRIVRTESTLDPRTRMVVAVARVEDPYGLQGSTGRPPLAVGLFVRAELAGVMVEDALTLPREALRGTGRVWVIDSEDRLRFRDIDVLRVTPERVVVRDGLSAGERVVVSPLETPTDGLLVRVEARRPAPAPQSTSGDRPR